MNQTQLDDLRNVTSSTSKYDDNLFHFEEDMDRWELVFFSATFSLLGFAAIFGNVITLIAFHLHPNLISRQAVSLYSLAVADLLNGFGYISMAVQFGSKINFYLSDASGDDVKNILGVLINAVQLFPGYCGALHTLLIACEKHAALVHPMKYYTRFTKKKAKQAVITIWIVSFSLNIAPFVVILTVFLLKSDPSELVYRIRKLNTVYQGFLSILAYVIITGTLVVFLGIIVLKMRRNKTTLSRLSQQTNTKKIKKSRDKIMRIYVIIVVYFVISYAPFSICSISAMFNTNLAAYKGVFYSALFASTNSCINLIVYIYVSKKFQLVIRQMFGLYVPRNSTNDRILGRKNEVFTISEGASDYSGNRQRHHSTSSISSPHRVRLDNN